MPLESLGGLPRPTGVQAGLAALAGGAWQQLELTLESLDGLPRPPEESVDKKTAEEEAADEKTADEEGVDEKTCGREDSRRRRGGGQHS